MGEERKMKDSGIEWIGEIPEEWDTIRAGNILVERKEKVSDMEFEPLSVTKTGIYRQLENVAKTDNNDNRKKVCVGDFVINSRSDRKQSCGLSSLEGSVSVINIVLINKGLNNGFLKYLLDNYGFAEEFYRWGSGIVDDLWSTKYSKFKKIMLPIPSLNDQQKIANFLDRKVGEIDRIIEKTRESIEEYKKYKQSLITETVTKGLDKNVKMKDSGIEWIGEIPEHWEIRKMKHVLKSQTNKNIYSHNYIGLENIEKGTGKFIDIREKTTIDGDTLGYEIYNVLFGKLRPYLAKVFLTNSNGCCSSEFLVLEPKIGIPEFYFFRLLSNDFIEVVNSSTYGAKMPRASWEFIRNLYIAIPSQDEQEKIIKHLQNKCLHIDKLVHQKQNLIVQLESYKKSLIYEAVTGKLEVS
jgi:type I restriction enzyme, S subunit